MPKLGPTPAVALPVRGLDHGLVAIHTHSLCLREVVVVPEDVLFYLCWWLIGSRGQRMTGVQSE